MTIGVTIPRVGLFATVRNRRGVISAVEPFDGDSGRLHLVHLEYKDDQLPHEEQLLWELEPHSRLLEPVALPNVATSDSMPGADFDALLRPRESHREHSLYNTGATKHAKFCQTALENISFHPVRSA